MMAHHLSKKLNSKEWQITVVDDIQDHYYQPGFLFVPFGNYTLDQIRKPQTSLLPRNVRFLNQATKKIDPENNSIETSSGEKLIYDVLIIATGSRIVPEETPGLTEEDTWRKTAFDFYTADGAAALFPAMNNFKGGNLVVHLAEMPIKCPVAPLEFVFLADYYFKRKGIRDKVNLSFVTPLDGAFTKPTAKKAFGNLMQQRNINVITEFNISEVDGQNKVIKSYDEKEVAFDLLVTVPVNMGSKLIEDCDLGDELFFIDTDPATLQSKIKENIFVLGDATNVGTSKAGSVAHFQSEILTRNILDFIRGKPFSASFDGHANCFIESGNKKGMLIDFNYTQEPVTGSFPLPVIGPLPLLKEARRNHLGKLAFRWIYWNMLLKARSIPFVSAHMKKSGKNIV